MPDDLTLQFHLSESKKSGGELEIFCSVRRGLADGSSERPNIFVFKLPPTEIDLDEIRWYLERYPRWPFGAIRSRALRIESKFKQWGQMLYAATIGAADQSTNRRADSAHRRISIEVEVEAGGSASLEREQEKSLCQAVNASLFALPWELLHGSDGYLIEGTAQTSISRNVRCRQSQRPKQHHFQRTPLRVLLVVARPEQEGVSLLDPRASVHGLAETLDGFGELAELNVLIEGTYTSLRNALGRAEHENRPYDIVHFDGHGAFDENLGVGVLCFEDESDAADGKLVRRVNEVSAFEMGELLRDCSVPLFVLEACQSAVSKFDPSSSVAAAVLLAGVGSVIAMSYAVLVETAGRFMREFYRAIVDGERISAAVTRGRRALKGNDPHSSYCKLQSSLGLCDWFVPVLFQAEGVDSPLFSVPVEKTVEANNSIRALGVGRLLEPPMNGFVGRTREIIQVQRLFFGTRSHRAVSIQGAGGQGKTALASEVARWLSQTRRVEVVAFLSMENVLLDIRVILDELGRQLVPGYSVVAIEGLGSTEAKLQRAMIPIEHVLRRHRVLIIVDNFESVLSEDLNEILVWLAYLSRIGHARLLLTSRQPLPQSFPCYAYSLDRLSSNDGLQLLARICTRHTWGTNDFGAQQTEDIARALVDTVAGHARSLVLLAPLVVERGLEVTRQAIESLLEELEEQHPGDRERSLLASVRLSLERLPPSLANQIPALAVFHGAASVGVIQQILEIPISQAQQLCLELVKVGLAEPRGNFILLDPALPAALRSDIAAPVLEGLEERWLDATIYLVEFLANEMHSDSAFASESLHTAQVEVAAAMYAAEKRRPADDALQYVVALEHASASLGHHKLAQISAEVRERLQSRQVEWTSAQLVATLRRAERLSEDHDFQGALQMGEEILTGSRILGDSWHEAISFAVIGRALVDLGQANEAEDALNDASRQFAELAKAGNKAAHEMLSNVIFSRGLLELGRGRLDKAEGHIQVFLDHSSEGGAMRDVAVAHGTLAQVLVRLDRLDEALAHCTQSAQLFGRIRDSKALATVLCERATISKHMGYLSIAESTYQQALRVCTESGNLLGETRVLELLGTLYVEMGRVLDGIGLQRQAVERWRGTGDNRKLARMLSNLAHSLLLAGLHDEARDAATAAGDLIEHWNSYGILYEIEMAVGQTEHANRARERCASIYRSYRAQGGAPVSPFDQLVEMVGISMQKKGGAQLARSLMPPVSKCAPELHFHYEVLMEIIGGECRMELVCDPKLSLVNAMELRFLMETLLKDVHDK